MMDLLIDAVGAVRCIYDEASASDVAEPTL